MSRLGISWRLLPIGPLAAAFRIIYAIISTYTRGPLIMNTITSLSLSLDYAKCSACTHSRTHSGRKQHAHFSGNSHCGRAFPDLIWVARGCSRPSAAQLFPRV